MDSRVLARDMLISIGKAATILGVAVSTLRRWDEEDRLPATTRTMGGHRRYELTTVLVYTSLEGGAKTSTQQNTSEQLPVVTYARVSGAKQAQNLETQSTHLKTYVEQQGWYLAAEYRDIGSGLNDQRKGLLKLVRDLPILRPAKIVVSYLDRIARFGTTVFQTIGEIFGAEIVVTHATTSEPSFEEQLTQDMIALVTSFAGKLHRARRGQNADFSSAIPG